MIWKGYSLTRQICRTEKSPLTKYGKSWNRNQGFIDGLISWEYKYHRIANEHPW